jgi:type VI secretion system secreted protein VgrG
VQRPPYALPGGNHMMGFKSNSTGGNGSYKGHSEMVINDTGGNELINIHPQKNMVTTVLNDKTSVITANHSTMVVKGNQENIVNKGDQTNTVKIGNQTTKVDTGSQTTEVKETITITSKANGIEVSSATHMTFTCGASSKLKRQMEQILFQFQKMQKPENQAHLIITQKMMGMSINGQRVKVLKLFAFTE